MNVTLTNFIEDPNESCIFCGKPQHTHFIDVGSVDGQRYAHHQPCDEQMKTLGAEKASRKKSISRFLEQWLHPKAA
ncbi:MAG: hypothetical protein HY273_17155 [Gammaproteobacteria bacterium]|nr:hypothetical protein [Gammaproteobacteria bacterium]